MDKIILTEDVNQMREQLQKAIVSIITNGLSDGTISEEKAKLMAQFVLDKLPEKISYQEFMEVLPTLDDEYNEFSSVVVPIMEQVEKKNKELMNDKIIQILKTGNIDEALKLTNDAIEQEKKLT